jgi:small RNA 2'-O-methyltransferase
MGSGGRRRERRRAALRRAGAELQVAELQVAGFGTPTPDGATDLHDERLDTVSAILAESGARTVLDLGCGSGALLERLVREDRFTRIVGVDSSIGAVLEARRRLDGQPGCEGERVRVLHGSYLSDDGTLNGFDAAAMVETIEHVPPERLSALEQVVFGAWKPSLVVVTTPNREFNVTLGLGEDEYRHPDHRFEWCRARFRRWASGVAARRGYLLESDGIGPRDPLHGSITQIAIFRAVDAPG